ncbi:ABC transporter substrate-binding protein [Kitasatospora sp. NPDC057692]|uniref:ABC transporter substrate-binding protein n=1 Tax=Kitasatospora sp. NPDC057692 TaxID=3346215 RepID=UPI003695BB34
MQTPNHLVAAATPATARAAGRGPRHTPRSAALLSAAVLLIGPAATACGSDTDTDSGSGPAVAGGTLRYAVETEPACIDPQVSPLDVAALIDRNIFDSLVELAPDGTIKPWLAERWEISDDRTAYTFHLRTGVTFHDGTVLDAAAVKATLDHAVDPKTKSQYAVGLLGPYAGADVVDPSTVRVRLSRPYTPILQALSTAYLGIQSPESLKRDNTEVCAAPVGSGPFSFAGWTKKQKIDLTRNDKYAWGPSSAKHSGAAYLDAISIQFIQEDSVRIGSLTSGQLDAVGGISPSRVAALKSNGKLQYLKAEAPGGVYAVHLNSNRGPLADQRVRTALQRSVNLDQLVSTVYFGQYNRAWSPLSPTTLGYAKVLENTWRYDPDLANRLLDEAGWTAKDADGFRVKDGKRLTLSWPFGAQLLREQRDVLAQGIAADAKKVGIEVNREGLDTGSYTKRVMAADADLWDASTVRAEPDILRTLFESEQLPAKGGMNVLKVNDPQLDEWLRHAAGAPHGDARDAEYVQVQKYVVDQALVIPVYTPSYLLGAAKSLRGLSFEPTGYPLFYDVSKGKGA